MDRLTLTFSTWVLLGTAAVAQQPHVGRGNRTPEPRNQTGADAPELRTAQLPYLQTFDPLNGIGSDDRLLPNAIGFNNRGVYWRDNEKQEEAQINIYHQPLIQIKLRVIEVVREDNLAAKTVLDYLRDRAANALVTQHTINSGRQRTTTSTRFPDETLLAIPNLAAGSGGIVNITGNHLNIITQFLATEFKADLITCPQVVTLNGQKVELVSGANVPFELGQSVLHDNTMAVQSTFYKHVGTNLAVTPRIINWGPRGEGVGRRPVMVKEIRDWNALAGMLSREEMFDQNAEADRNKDYFKKYAGTTLLMPYGDQRKLLDVLNGHDPRSVMALLRHRLERNPAYPYRPELLFRPAFFGHLDESGCPCHWNPAHCTLDVELVLRQSDTTGTPSVDLTGATARTRNITAEEIGAAIANVVQLKNGHGAVIAGLIGERDIRTTSKVPVLGDIPWIGSAFRSRSTNRQRTEIVIFLEAEILASEPFEAVAQAAHDFELTRPYVQGDVLANPLEAGMQRAGFGSYLPPRSHHERVYWERLGRKVQKSSTAIHDILR